MKTWIIEPRDPLIVRDGRPFENTPGARARSLDFPFPSTTTGGVRTRYGLARGGDFDAALIAEVKTKSVRGPLLVELDANGGIESWMFTAPADALWFEYDQTDDKHAALKCLVPLRLRESEQTNLAGGLYPVGLIKPDSRKPFGYAPRFWHWGKFEQWLEDTAVLTVVYRHAITDIGHSGPTSEERTHVSITPDTQTAAEGALYQTRGLEFTRSTGRERLLMARRLALVVTTDADPLASGLAPLGGERRLVNWRESTQRLPTCPPKVRTKIQKTAACRVVLLTPAYFTQGFRPTWLLQSHAGVTAELKATVVPRAQVVSGWDFDRRYGRKGEGRAKPTRRLAPAGSVYYLKLTGTPEAIGVWVDAMWMNCASDEDADRQDGFGLIALGAWSGECEPMEDR
ncbi:MAG: type III-B CRISPR module-associated protein Cmr3 [Acidobacteria bacterium]|nr:type III-B CRISPR module-associated protein Cmr3 [Acidobacteriota bacterium]